MYIIFKRGDQTCFKATLEVDLLFLWFFYICTEEACNDSGNLPVTGNTMGVPVHLLNGPLK